MNVDSAIRTRRTHKAYRAEPVAPALLDHLFELARWAPNHHLSNPWRFRVIGPVALEALKAAADAERPGSSRKLERAPTLVAATAVQSGDPVRDREDLLATGVAIYLVMLAAHVRGLGSYWRTVPLLDTPAGRAALGIPAGEAAVGLLHLGHPLHTPSPPPRAAVDEVVRHLD